VHVFAGRVVACKQDGDVNGAGTVEKKMLSGALYNG
jgi:hypothetical protein